MECDFIISKFANSSKIIEAEINKSEIYLYSSLPINRKHKIIFVCCGHKFYFILFSKIL